LVSVTGRDIAFWQKTFLLTIAVVVILLFLFLPIFELPIEGTETTIKLSLIEFWFGEDFLGF